MTLLHIDLELPDHTKQLTEAENYIESLKKQIALQSRTRMFDNKTYQALYDKITHALYYVGGLSESAFATEDIIEKEYFKVYKHAPELAKKLWQDHYGQIHRPYNVLKNRLFRLYEVLSEAYLKVNKLPPPRM